jgi:diaminohydroxyphosphoribosylaminopyrimidine deaminase/5-amino-6-(5-phosphoribosylamino)uracil reductase
VAGRGLALLRRAGIEVETGLLGGEAARLDDRFLAWARLGRPFVLLKAALTLDGRIATASGRSRWITDREQRSQARWLRRLQDAVVVGVGTALADDPLLLPSPRTRRPFLRVVVDSRLRLPERGRLARTATPRSPVVVLSCAPEPARRRRLEASGVEVAEVAGEDGRVSPAAALAALAARGVASLMVEGGGELLGSFLAARLADQVALFRAPLLLGGRGSRPAFGGPDPRDVEDALRLEPVPPDPPFPWPWTPRFELWRPAR